MPKLTHKPPEYYRDVRRHFSQYLEYALRNGYDPLELSIERWTRIVEVEKAHGNHKSKYINCPLCMAYLCKDCPVCKYTGLKGCKYTPFDQYQHATSIKERLRLAQLELEFLKMLRNPPSDPFVIKKW